ARQTGIVRQALGLAASSAIVYALLQLHILPDDLTPWVFIMAFVSVFLGVFGKRSSARPLAVLRQRMAELGTSIDSPSSDMSEAGAESDTPEQLLRQSRAPSDTA
ncbi:hypothetical protein, partial [Streptomyces sp. SID6139]